MPIPKEQKLGVYALDSITFQTYGGKTLPYRGDIGRPRFEVIPEREAAPTVHQLTIHTKGQWQAMRRRDQY